MPSKTYKRRLRFQQRLHRKRVKKRLKRIKKGRPHQTNLQSYDRGKKRLAHNLRKRKYTLITAPQTFSFQRSPEEAGKFFIKLESAAEKQSPIRIDLSQVELITIDTLLYLLAILDRYEARRVDHHVEGNVPKHQEAYKSFQESGFINYVSRQTPSNNNPAVQQIIAGDTVDQEIAKQLCNLVMNSFGWSRQQTRFLFEIIIEMMTNTIQHAYAKKHGKKPNKTTKHKKKEPTKWYLYAEYNPKDACVSFCFLDTGQGIPKTLRRTTQERINTIFAIKPKDSQLIMSALKGDFRTQTGLSYRGKGLPRIYSFSENHSISNLLVLSNQGLVSGGNATNIQTSVKGTLYTWRVVKSG